MPWWKSLFPKRASDEQMNSELRFHMDELTEEYIAAGMPPEEAHRRAKLDFGGHESLNRLASTYDAAKWCPPATAHSSNCPSRQPLKTRPANHLCGGPRSAFSIPDRSQAPRRAR